MFWKKSKISNAYKLLKESKNFKNYIYDDDLKYGITLAEYFKYLFVFELLQK